MILKYQYFSVKQFSELKVTCHLQPADVTIVVFKHFQIFCLFLCFERLASFFFSFKIFLYIFSFLQLFCLFLKIEVQKKKLWYIDLYDRILFNHEKNEILVFVMT